MEAVRPFKEEMPVPPVELTTSNENPRGAVEEAVKTLPSAPVTVVKAFVPEAIMIPRVNVFAPLPPEETSNELVRVRVPMFAFVPVAFVKVSPCSADVPNTTKAEVGVVVPTPTPEAFIVNCVCVDWLDVPLEPTIGTTKKILVVVALPVPIPL